MEKYVSKSKTMRIDATSRCSLKIKDTFYTFEYREERALSTGADIEKERQMLWDTVHSEVDKQVQEILDATRR